MSLATSIVLPRAVRRAEAAARRRTHSALKCSGRPRTRILWAVLSALAFDSASRTEFLRDRPSPVCVQDVWMWDVNTNTGLSSPCPTGHTATRGGRGG